MWSYRFEKDRKFPHPRQTHQTLRFRVPCLIPYNSIRPFVCSPSPVPPNHINPHSLTIPHSLRLLRLRSLRRELA